MALDLGKMLSDAAKGVSDFIERTGKDITKAIDQNGDGKLDLSDLQVVSDKIQAGRAEAQRIADLKRLNPLFPDEFESAEFVMPKMVCIGQADKAHLENDVCKGSIGFKTVVDDMPVITIYRDYVDELDISFYPELDNNVYYVDPCDRDHYISLEQYFLFMKEKRVAELQKIAQALGAKHFKVTYKERSQFVSSNSFDTSDEIKAGIAKADAKANHSVNNSSMSTISIEAEMRFPGHEPVKPELHYLKKEINIINLIELRMDPLSPLQHQHLNIEMSNSVGIRAKDAIKIDAALKAMKIASNIAIASEVQKEARRILEYEIEF